ncbi:MAG: hypothetical protein V4614_17035 [Pseudomonadota bacterium]
MANFSSCGVWLLAGLLGSGFCGIAGAADADAVMVATAPATVQPLRVDFSGEVSSPEARFAAQWVAGNADNHRLPFAIVDKKNARLYIFGADGRLRGATTVLLGLAVGDGAVPDMATREISSLRPAERTTPAGRFAAEPGHNLNGEDIVWVDYDSKIAIHRLRPDAAYERRAQRLASSTIDDNRISMGCIVTSVSFYENVVRPVLGKSRSVVYVLPDTRSLQGMLGALQASRTDLLLVHAERVR